MPGGGAISTTSVAGADLHHGYEFDSTPVAASARWENGQLTLTWCYVETAFRDTLVVEFDGESIVVRRSVNVNSGATEWAPLEGRAVGAGLLEQR